MALVSGECAASLLRVCAALALALPAGFRADAAESDGPSGPPPQVRALRVDVPPLIDGRLDEPAWSEAPSITGLRQREPDEGELMTQQTVVRFLYDGSHLYIGIRCLEDPGLLTARTMVRDEPMLSDDVVSLRFDSFNDERNAFQFAINPLGNKVDALIEGSTWKPEWDGIWHVKTSVDEEGWVVEMALPFQTIGFEPGATSWGFQVMRTVTGLNEMGTINNWQRNVNIFSSADLPRVTGLEGIAQGVGLDVKPSFSLRHRRLRSGQRRNVNGDPALDVFYKITPSVTAALTFNTDFSEAAVDERQVNLTRFGLFFPEQRDFFLQDARIFAFANRDEGNGIPFFSRRIGLAPDGSEVDIDAGAKVTGRIGDVNVGLLSVRMEPLPDADARQLSVARLQLNVLEESSIGLIGTLGDPDSNAGAGLVGADANFRTSKLRGRRTLEGGFWGMRSWSEGRSDREASFGARIAYPNDTWNWSVEAQELQEHFEPALGFVNRTGIRQYDADLRRRWRPGGRVHSADAKLDARLVTDVSNRVESVELALEPLRLENRLGDGVALRLVAREERLLVPFEIAEGVTLPVDRYRFDRAELDLEASRSRAVNGTLTLGWGQFFSGRRFELRAVLKWFLGTHFNWILDYQQNDIRLPEGDFTTRLGRLRLNVQFSPQLSWNTITQYDNVSDAVSLNSRIRWILDPGNEVFLVWNHGYSVDGSHLRSETSQITSKLGWTFRF